MPGRHHQQGVAVWITFGNLGSAQSTPSARPVFNHHCLPHAHIEPLADDARHDVGRAPCREGHDDLDDLVWVVEPRSAARRLGPGRSRYKSGDGSNNNAFHG